MAGSSGGVGASVLAAAVGVRAAYGGLRVACVDTRPGAGGLDVVFGLEQERGLRWPDLRELSGETDGARMHASLPSVAGVAVLAGHDGPAGAPGPTGVDERGSVRDGERGSVPDGERGSVPDAVGAEVVSSVVAGLSSVTDLVVVDLGASYPTPRGLVDTLGPLVLVMGTDPHQLAAGCAAARHWAHLVDEVFLCLRAPRPDADLADMVASALDLPVLGCLADDERVRADLARGAPPASGRQGPLAALAQRCVDELVPGPGRRPAPVRQVRRAS